MELQLQGVITVALGERSGVSKAGKAWAIASYVLEYENGQYPAHCCFDVFGDRIQEYSLQVGDHVQVWLDIDAREWQGKWYNSIRAYRCSKERFDNVPAASVGGIATSQPINASQIIADTAQPADDMPF